ncbi:hypothetical protein Q4517_13185 [Tenacibaculum sp. 1_MG-2023]|uniref:hypothetical protein n=1 Tax=Tenacibaculum sp. 1_MG-2023 TaxID=3062653 RepID=UPI0026E4410D|nr:hypothetical protein [Tenacibaculum sp. 1_MG-2023]MDO6676499.1 hypothetical protein [Tenacibaculum sp. 1_MG-2023]
MLKFLKKIFSKKETFFGATSYETDNMICGVGKARILETEVEILAYPFKPSFVFPNKKIKASEITAICYQSYPPLIKIDNEVILISREHTESLKEFAKRNNIATFKETKNWNWLLEPYLDTAFTPEEDIKTTQLLNRHGVSTAEIAQIRNEVGKQMYKYNFDTMLWDWFSLGLPDVLVAMRVKYNEKKFADFYKRAMEIELRKTKTNN